MLMMAAWCGAIAWRPAISRRVSAAAVAPSVERRRHYDPVESNPIGLERELIPLFWNGGHFLQRRNPGGGGGEEEEEEEGGGGRFPSGVVSLRWRRPSTLHQLFQRRVKERRWVDGWVGGWAGGSTSRNKNHALPLLLLDFLLSFFAAPE